MGSWDSLSRIPFTSACQFAFIRRVPTDKGGFPVKRVFATNGSDLEKTSFGDGASLLGSLDSAVNTDVIVIDSDWGRPKISGIDLLVNSPGLARFSRGTHNVRRERGLNSQRKLP